MYYLIASGVLLLVFIALIIKEKRRFYNAVVLFASLSLGYFGLAEISYNHNWDSLYNILLVFLYGIVPALIFFLSVLLVIDTIILLKREGKTLKNLLPLAFSIFLIAGVIFTVFALMGSNNNILVYLSIIVAGITIYCAVVFISFLIYSILYSFMPKNKNADYIIIHGSGLIGGDRVPPLLASRIDKGIELFHNSGDKAMIIASGGQGSDESISEAQAICDYMLSKGVPLEKIIVENNSVNTQENIEFSKEIIEQRQNCQPYKCLFVTSNYHVFRTSLLARKAKLKGEGVGARTKWYYWITAFLREYVAIIVKYKWILIAYIIIVLVLLIYSFTQPIK